MNRIAVALGLVALGLASTACSSSGSAGRTSDPTSSTTVAALTVTSPQFAANGTIPSDYTCNGSGSVPTISWTGDLHGAASVAVIVDDPDAPNGTYTHRVVLDLPPTTKTLGATPPAGAKQGLNSNGAIGWTPPCPPSGTHHYRFTVYGLSKPTGLAAGATIKAATAAITATTVARGALVGLVSA